MDELIIKLTKDYDLDECEALVVIGIMGIVAYSNNTIETACDIVDEKLKSIAKKTLAMA